LSLIIKGTALHLQMFLMAATSSKNREEKDLLRYCMIVAPARMALCTCCIGGKPGTSSSVIK
ncbi:MAG: hypothetical protein MUO88_22670, partial [Desulfobacterales bacterium]|nr:hypothetical protein [Desulfobacterales bacterium]